MEKSIVEYLNGILENIPLDLDLSHNPTSKESELLVIDKLKEVNLTGLNSSEKFICDQYIDGITLDFRDKVNLKTLNLLRGQRKLKYIHQREA